MVEHIAVALIEVANERGVEFDQATADAIAAYQDSIGKARQLMEFCQEVGAVVGQING